MTKTKKCNLEAHLIESLEMYDNVLQHNPYINGYKKGYRKALVHIKSEIEQKIADKEKWLKNVPLEDYVSSVASREYNIKVGLTIVRNLIDGELNNKNKLHMYDIILQQSTRVKETKDFLHSLGIPLSDASVMASQALNGKESVILTTNDLNLIHNTVKLLHNMGCAAIIKEVP